MEYLEPILLKDGRLCILRSGTDADGEAALENFIRTHEQTDYLLSYPDEIRFTAAEEGEFLRKKTESADEVEILAEVDGKIIGLAGIGRCAFMSSGLKEIEIPESTKSVAKNAFYGAPCAQKVQNQYKQLME